MAKKLATVLVMILIAATLTACTNDTATQSAIRTPALTIEVGAYGYDSAIATNTSTG